MEEWDSLVDALPRLARESLRVDGADFRRKFAALLALLDQHDGLS